MARWFRWTEIQASNALIKAYSEKNPRLHYVDIAPGMLGSDGRPMPQLFVEDGLHLSPAGYTVWNPIVAKAIAAVRADTSSSRPRITGQRADKSAASIAQVFL